MKRVYLLFIVQVLTGGLLFTNCAFAQKDSEPHSGKGQYTFKFDSHKEKYATDYTALFREKLKCGNNDTFELLREEQDDAGFHHQRFQQFYKGIKVEHAQTIVHSRNGLLTFMNGESPSMATVNTTPTLAEAEALQQALNFVKAMKYKWEDAPAEKALKDLKKDNSATYYPKGELVICKILEYNHPRQGDYTLAYKFDVYAAEPLSREYIYVDANDGSIVLRDAIIKHTNVTGTAATRYSGARTINTEFINGTYRLRDNTRGSGIITARLDINNNAYDVIDNDNNWTAAEYKNATNDDAALDAHWGAMMTYDYWKNVHGRNGYDNNNTVLFNYVHFGGPTYANASWDGTDKVMLYGDGNGSPFTSLDICAHEIGHAVMQYTANLVYSNESGALNEGFSDIWGASVEYNTDPSKQTWLIGEEVIGGGDFIRSMSNPNLKNQPDTYMGQYWYTGAQDYGGVHENSGVLNYWFYLLAKGGSGWNDTDLAFNVSSIGIDKAAKIAYRTESVYLTSSAQFIDVMNASIQATIDLYGVGSNEVTQVLNAWSAVGVYDVQFPAPSGLQASLPALKQIDLNWTDNSTNETGFAIERAAPGVYYSVLATVAADVTTYSDLTVAGNTSYSYRVKALRNYTTSAYSNSVAAGTMVAPAFKDISNESTSGFSFNWFPVPTATSYQIDIASDALFTTILPGYQNLGVNGLLATASGLPSGTTYFCRVRATNGVLTSANSTTLTITTFSSNIPTPTTAQLIGAGYNGIYKMNKDGSGLHIIKNTGRFERLCILVN